MDALSIIRIIIGVILIFYLPGYLIIRLYYKNIKGLENLALSIGLSVVISIFSGLILALLGIFSLVSSLIFYAIIIAIIFLYQYIRQWPILKKHKHQ